MLSKTTDLSGMTSITNKSIIRLVLLWCLIFISNSAMQEESNVDGANTQQADAPSDSQRTVDGANSRHADAESDSQQIVAGPSNEDETAFGSGDDGILFTDKTLTPGGSGERGGYGLCDFLEDSMYHAGFCFRAFENLLTWEEAKLSCPKDMVGGSLAEPEEPAVIEFMYTLAMETNIKTGVNVNIGTWIGASRSHYKETFVWASNGLAMWDVPPDIAVNDWPKEGTNDSCVLITTKGHIGARPCDWTRKRICQVSVDPLCPTGTRYYDGYCYFVLDETANYNTAKQICSNTRNSSLVEIYTSDAAQFLKKFLFEKLWTTLNSKASGKITYLKDYGIEKKPGEDFCFAVRGLGEASMTLYADNSGVGCIFSIVFGADRNTTEIKSTTKTCDSCMNICTTQTEREHPVSGSEWSYYCINQTAKWQSVSLMYTNGHAIEVADLYHEHLTQEMTHVSLETQLGTYQWRFPSNHGSLVYLGATGTTSQWESGVDIDFGLLGEIDADAFWVNGKDRLMFQNFPTSVLPASADEEATILCRFKWGIHSYIGFVPLELYATSRLFLINDVQTTAVLLNYDPNIANGILTKTDVMKPSMTVLMSDIWDTKSEQLRFVVRSNVIITVELFSSSGDEYVFSTLILPDITTDTEYVICAPETATGLISIMNYWQPNEASIQIPQYREIYVVGDHMVYRVYHMTSLKMDPLQLISITVKGDMSGVIVSGKKKMSVFIGATQMDSAGISRKDIHFSQLLPATKLGRVYPSLYFDLASLPSLPNLHYTAVAMANGTDIEITNQPDIPLSLWGDTWVQPVTAANVQVMMSNYPIHATYVISDGTMSCAMTLLPPRYWKEQYNLWVTPIHKPVILLLITDGETTKKINGIESDLNCLKIPLTNYHSCYTQLDEGNYTISSVAANQLFAAYILGYRGSNSCFLRMVEMKQTNKANNAYQPPTFVEPEKCPNITVPIPPTISPTQEITNSTTMTTVAPTHPPTPVTRRQHSHPYSNSTMSENEIDDEIREEVKKELAVNERKTSSFVRKKISAKDPRTSSTTMGYAGIAVISMTACLVIIPDAVSFSVWLLRWFNT